MARPLRIEYPGPVYHITTRGNAYQDIFLDDADREKSSEAHHTTTSRHLRGMEQGKVVDLDVDL